MKKRRKSNLVSFDHEGEREERYALDGDPVPHPDVGALPRIGRRVAIEPDPEFGLGRETTTFRLGVCEKLIVRSHEGPGAGLVEGEGAVKGLDL
jgi:hypothetical protein